MKIIFISIAALLLPLLSTAQQQNITGTVIEQETSEPLPGATVVIKGTTTGVQTDFDGNFQIAGQVGDVLVVSFIGMKTQEVESTATPMTIVLASSATQLNEVTVSVGYFDISKKDLSGSISQVTSEQLERNRNNSIESLLQGQVAGVVISESSEPGGGLGISIRGTNSLLGGTQPLYVVDGIPIDPLTDAEGNTNGGQSQSTLGFLNPNDIEKMEVLKDAAATAIYGARGANGVVVITTKTADKANGKDIIELTYDANLSSVTKTLDVLDGPNFERYINQRVINQLYKSITNPARTGLVFDGTQALTEENFPELASFVLPFSESTGVSTNWQDLIYRQAFSNSISLGYRGGNFKKNLSIRLGLIDRQGIIINSSNKRLIYNMNAKRKAFNDKVDFFSRTNILYQKGNASSVGNGQIFQQRSVVANALQFQPIYTLLEPGEDDEIYAEFNDNNPISNPYTLAKFVVDQRRAVTLRQVFQLTTKIVPKLTATAKTAFDYQRTTRDIYYPSNTTRGRASNGEATRASRENRKIYVETNLRYRNKFGKHRIDAILVGTLEKNVVNASFNRARNFATDDLLFNSFESATDIFVPEFEYREIGLLSGLFRVGYNYKQKYFLDINGRVDASSKLAQNNKARFFPSIALSWTASKEKFIRKIKAISNLKFRLSYGQTGSNPIDPYQSLGLLSPIQTNFDDELAIGFFESNLVNDDLTWEITDQVNFGIDLGLFDSKINITIDAYYKETRDLLQNVRLPVSNGFRIQADNFGTIENKGIELSINAELLNTNNFNWNVLGNFSLNRNRLISLNSNLDFQLGPTIGFANTNPIIFKVGQPLGIFWGAQTDGIYQDWEEANASGIEGAAPGEIKYINHSVEEVALDENGLPQELQQINFDDFVKIGDPNPDYTVGITNNFRYKNWDLSVLFTGQKGGDLFWVDTWPLAGLQRTTNVLTDAFNDSWTAPLTVLNGEVTYDPAAGRTTGVSNPAPATNINGPRDIPSDRQVFDGSFIRLKSINLGYTFQLKKGKDIRLYASGQNLITWTNYPGYDPEIQTFVRNPQRRGVDFGNYPGTRTYTFGLRIKY